MTPGRPRSAANAPQTGVLSEMAFHEKAGWSQGNSGFIVLALVGDLVDDHPDRLFGTLYLDKEASPEQSDALTRIVEYMNEMANQPPVPLRKIKVVPITFEESNDRTNYAVDIPGTLQEKTRLQRDKAGKARFTMAAMDLWTNTLHNADNVQFKYHDPAAGEGWDYSGHYANVKYFDVTKTMYAEQKMLGEHGDNSGKWTPKQLEIIRREGLEEKLFFPQRARQIIVITSP